MSIDSEVVLQILRRSPQGLTPLKILDHLLTQPQYQGRSRQSIFTELLPVLQSLRNSQVVAHVSPCWVLVESVESTSVELGDGTQDVDSSEEEDESEFLITQDKSESLKKCASETTGSACNSTPEILLYYLSKQCLPVDFEDIYAELSQFPSISRDTVSRHLNRNQNYFKKFGRSNFYGVAGRRYELPEQELLSLLVAKLKSGQGKRI